MKTPQTMPSGLAGLVSGPKMLKTSVWKPQEMLRPCCSNAQLLSETVKHGIPSNA